MVEETRLDVLQDEIKLLKAEVKNSLASVRDYLLNMELPSSEFSTILAALSGDNADPQKMEVDSHISGDGVEGIQKPDLTEEKPDTGEGDLSDEQDQPEEYGDMLDFEEPEKVEETTAEMPEESMFYEEDSMTDKDSPQPKGKKATETPDDEDDAEEEDVLPEDALLPEDEADETESDKDIADGQGEVAAQETELPLEEVPSMEYERPMNEVNRGIPKVNMLANLINWIARASREIGYEQLPAFLEVYGTTGHLSPELKDVIIHLAEIVKDHSEAATESEIWSQSILSLHGILTGGDAPLDPVIPSWADTTDEAEISSEEEIIEVDKTKNKPAKLKLVFPNDNGESKEFCINLTPEENDESK